MPSSSPALVSAEAFYWLICFQLSQYQGLLINLVPGGRDLVGLSEPQARVFIILRDVVAATFEFLYLFLPLYKPNGSCGSYWFPLR